MEKPKRGTQIPSTAAPCAASSEQPPARSHPSSNSRGLLQEATKEKRQDLTVLAHDTHLDLGAPGTRSPGLSRPAQQPQEEQQKNRNPSGFVAKPSRNRSGAIPGWQRCRGVNFAASEKKLKSSRIKKQMQPKMQRDPWKRSTCQASP